MQRRKGEIGRSAEHQVRTNRLVETADGWYFRTREGIEIGPYPSEFDAGLGASLLVARLAQLDEDADFAAHIRAFLADPAHNPRGPELDKFERVDLDALRRANRRRRQIETCRAACDTAVRVVQEQAIRAMGAARRMAAGAAKRPTGKRSA